MGDWRQIQPFGKIFADQAVGILIGRSLPWAVRAGEIDVDLQALGKDFMARHLLALVVGQRFSHARRDMAELSRERFQRGLGRTAAQLGQQR